MASGSSQADSTHADTYPYDFPLSTALCAVNGTLGSLEAVRQALALVGPRGMVRFVAVSDARGQGFVSQASLSESHAREALDTARHMAAGAGPAVETALLFAEDPRQALISAAEALDVLVVGTHRRSRAAGILLGSTASTAVHRARVPVLVARASSQTGFAGTILAAVAGPEDEQTARISAAIAAANRGNLVLLHAGRGDRELRHELALEAAEAASITGAEPTVLNSTGDPVHDIPTVAQEVGAALVVLGSHGRQGVGSLGSVSERVAHRLACSALVLRHPADR